MIENKDKIVSASSDVSTGGASVQSSSASSVSGSKNPPATFDNRHTDIQGRFNQYTSGFWALALPALAARYVGRYAGQLFGFTKAGLAPSDAPQPKGKLSLSLYPSMVGGWMAFITGVYATKTYGDMKRVFAETLACEFNKRPEDIGFNDFRHSKNVIVKSTFDKFISYNMRRLAVSSTFFAFMLPEHKKFFKTKQVDSVDLGVGVSGAYLVSDVLLRKETFFEALQNFIDHKINHVDYAGDPIRDTDLIRLYAFHARDNDPKNIISGKKDMPEWKNSERIFGRMAEMMNKTYGNIPNDDNSNMTIPKVIYLLGEGLLQVNNPEQSLAMIEVANRHGIETIKQVAEAVHKGVSIEDALKAYPQSNPSPVQESDKAPDISTAQHVARLTAQKQMEALSEPLLQIGR